MHRNDRGVSTLIIILCVALVLAALLGMFVLRRHAVVSGPASARPGRPALNPEQKAQLASVEFSDLQMSAADNFLGTTVTYLDARVTNKGTKAIRLLDVELNFVDTLHQVVLRETAHPLSSGGAPLKPGDTRAFRVSFEHMPEDWNQAPPSITPVYLEF
jgi:hypothetical protein